MKRKVLLLSLFLAACITNTYAENLADTNEDNDKIEKTITNEVQKKSRLIFGGYGEAVLTCNFYSDNYLRYTSVIYAYIITTGSVRSRR